MMEYFQLKKFLVTVFVTTQLISYEHVKNGDFICCKEAVSEEGKRAVYHDEEKFVKIWDKRYRAQDKFLRALAAGFYEGLTPDLEVIYDEQGICRGYATPYLKNSDLPVVEVENEYGKKVLGECAEQTVAYRDLYQRLLERSATTDLYYLDLTPSNLVAKDDSLLLIDLELVLTREELRSIPRNRFNEIARHLSKEYALYLQNQMIDMTLLEQAMKIPTGGSAGGHYYSLEVKGQSFKGERDWQSRWDLMKDEIDYTNQRVLELGCNTAIASVYLMKYRAAGSAFGVDGTDELLAGWGRPRQMEAAALFQKAFNVEMEMKQLDFNKNDYEQMIGNDFDVAIAMSILKWVDDKERFLDYLAQFKHVIFEGHEADEIEIARFTSRGFQYKRLGETQIGISYAPEATRTLFHFYK